VSSFKHNVFFIASFLVKTVANEIVAMVTGLEADGKGQLFCKGMSHTF
jgi:hypothetical protein